MSYVLGISGGYYHDSSACVLKDGKVLYVVEEERISGEKHALDRMPNLCIKRALDYCGIKPKDIDAITLSWNPYHPEKRELKITDECFSMIFDKKEWEGLEPKVVHIDHHISHASATYRTSGFDKALVFCLDGSGDGKATSVYMAEKGKMELLESLDETQSLGWFYQRLAPYIGIGKWYHSGKTMALAALGKPKYKFEFITTSEDGYKFIYPSYLMDGITKENHENVMKFYKKLEDYLFDEFEKLIKLEPLVENIDWISGNKLYQEPSEEAKDLAASLQKCLEESITAIVNKYHSLYPELPICFGGGISMNCKAMGELQYSINSINNIYVSPFSTDISGSIGSALEYNHIVNSDEDTNKINNAYLGDGFTDEEVIEILSELKLDFKIVENPSQVASELILNNKVVGWFQGRMEVGARALGNRSIVALPSSVELKDKINLEIKNREIWRPFSPSVLGQENAKKYWDSKFDISKYMTMAYKLREGVDENLFKGVFHVDKTSRPQVVNRNDNPRYAELLSILEEKGLPPVVLNTSLNLRGMPIARTPKDALKVFFGSTIDAMIIGKCVLQKCEK